MSSTKSDQVPLAAPEPSSPPPAPAASAARPQTAAEPHGDDPVNRQKLIRRYCEDATDSECPLAANLVVLNSDLLQIAATLAENLRQPRHTSLARPDHFGEYAKRAELFMKVVRQVDRFAQLDRQLSQGDR